MYTFLAIWVYYNEAGFELNDKFAANLELLTSSGEYNYAGYLLADSNGNSIKVAKYAGLDRVDLIENNEYGYCSLVKAAKYVLDKLELENPTFSRITYKKRINKRLWDHVAVREAIINALIHNDYSNGVPPKFEIFDDRLEITSAGGTILGINEDEFFDGFSNPRNQELMRIFKDLDMVEQLGSGMPRILKAYPKECFRFTQNFLRITFPMSPDAIKLLNAEDEAATKAVITDDASGSEKSSEKSSEYKIDHLIGLMSENPNITTYEIADELNISTRMVEKYLSQLKEKGIIVRIGGRKTGHWEVLE
ncbi:ATP-binding protein [Methanoplanus limicola]|uniref:ATP-binding protein n=1 Tax=Methanoplanus limicola TaxID=2315 RepID=UPI000693C171|nr:ATP-binding protein [Methanoplanus limicola]